MNSKSNSSKEPAIHTFVISIEYYLQDIEMPQLFCALFCTPKVYTVKAQLSSNQHVESMSTGLKTFKSSYENGALGRPRGIEWRGR